MTRPGAAGCSTAATFSVAVPIACPVAVCTVAVIVVLPAPAMVAMPLLGSIVATAVLLLLHAALVIEIGAALNVADTVNVTGGSPMLEFFVAGETVATGAPCCGV